MATDLSAFPIGRKIAFRMRCKQSYIRLRKGQSFPEVATVNNETMPRILKNE